MDLRDSCSKIKLSKGSIHYIIKQSIPDPDPVKSGSEILIFCYLKNYSTNQHEIQTVTHAHTHTRLHTIYLGIKNNLTAIEYETQNSM